MAGKAAVLTFCRWPGTCRRIEDQASGITQYAQLRGGEKMPTSGASGGRSHQTNSQAYFSIAVERGRLAWYAAAYFAGMRRGGLLRR